MPARYSIGQIRRIDDVEPAERRIAVEQLLAGMDGRYGNGHLWTLVDSSGDTEPWERLVTFVQGCGVTDSGLAHGVPPRGVRNVDDLRSVLHAASADAGIAALTDRLSRTLAYGRTWRYTEREARKLVADVALTMTSDARWMLGGWVPGLDHDWDDIGVTAWINDAIVVCMNDDLLVAVLVVDED